MSTAPATDDILTVSEITRLIKGTLEGAFPRLWVKGEISGMRRLSSGHQYFSIKDSGAVLPCVAWKSAAGRIGFELQDGLEVELGGSLEVYAPQGKYQFIVREARQAGLGALLLQLEELKRRLQAEGLFDPARKRALPRFPTRVGLVTSPTGAAFQDLLKVLQARWPSIGIVLAGVRVQGEGAAAEIAGAIERFNREDRADVLIVGRGGGSIEDLWAFNQEIVVRAIAASRIPVISAVGHEVDTTLADFAADVRAATPSNAAELAVPNRDDVQRHAELLASSMRRAVHRQVQDGRQRLDTLLAQYGFRRQRDIVDRMRERIAEALGSLRAGARGWVGRARESLLALSRRYGLREFPRALAARREQVALVRGRLSERTKQAIEARRQRLLEYDARLRALSPRNVMERGYCLVRAADGTLLRTAEALTVGERITVEFARGEADARIEQVRRGGAHGADADGN